VSARQDDRADLLFNFKQQHRVRAVGHCAKNSIRRADVQVVANGVDCDPGGLIESRENRGRGTEPIEALASQFAVFRRVVDMVGTESRDGVEGRPRISLA